MGTSNQRQHIRPQSSLTTRLKQWRRQLALGTLLALLAGIWTWQEQASTLSYASDWGEAQAWAYAEDRLCLVYFKAPYCFACELAEERLFRQPALVRQLQEAYVTYQVDGMQPGKGKALAQKYGVMQFPAIVLTDAEGELIQNLSLHYTDERIIKELRRSATLRTGPARAARLPGAGLETANGNTESQDAFGAERGKQTYGLKVDHKGSWIAAMMQAEKEAKAWVHQIWVHPSSSRGYDIILGPFVSKGEAQKTRQFLRTWEGRDAAVIRLRNKAIVRPHIPAGPDLKSERGVAVD